MMLPLETQLRRMCGRRRLAARKIPYLDRYIETPKLWAQTASKYWRGAFQGRSV